MAGLFHRDAQGAADPDAPVLSLADLVAHLKSLPRAPDGQPAARPEDARRAAARRKLHRRRGSSRRGTGGRDRRRLALSRRSAPLRRAMPGARLGYDPMLAASRDQGSRAIPGAAASPHGTAEQEASRSPICASTPWSPPRKTRFPLVRRLLDLGIETDAWTVNPGRDDRQTRLRTLARRGVRQITTDAPSLLAGQIEFRCGPRPAKSVRRTGLCCFVMARRCLASSSASA